MEFSDILKLPKGTVIPEVRGRVIKVYEPYRPSPAQDRAGIHKQPIILQNDGGENLCIDILSIDQHLPFSAEGGIWVFRSVPNEQGGELHGLSVDIWTGDKGENFSVQVNRKAHLYEESSAASAPPTTGPVANWQHETKFYCSILSDFEERLVGSPIWDALLTDPHSLTAAVSSVYIECGRNGTKSTWIREQLRAQGLFPTPTPQTRPAAQTQPRPQERAAAPAEEPRAEPPAEPPAGRQQEPSTLTHKPPAQTQTMNKESPEAEIALMIYGGIPTDAVKELVGKVFGSNQPNFEVIMDKLFGMLQRDGVQLAHIHTAYDWAKEAIKKNAPPDKGPVKNEAVCKNIAYGFGRFRSFLEDAQKVNAPAAPGIGEQQDVSDLAPLD